MVSFIPHALLQMGKRRITQANVELVLSNYHTSYPSLEPGRECFVGTLGERRIEVVVETDEDGNKRVITAYDQLEEEEE